MEDSPSFSLQHDGRLSIDLPTSYLRAIDTATVHRDEGPTVVTLKCKDSESAELLARLVDVVQEMADTGRGAPYWRTGNW